MSQERSAAPQPPECPLGVPPEEVAAWAVDGEAYGPVDLDTHVPTCAACQEVVASVQPSRSIAERLRDAAAAEVAVPVAVVDRALRQVRMEHGAWLLARTLGGAFVRVAAAVPDYVGGPTAAGGPDGEDTAEFDVSS